MTCRGILRYTESGHYLLTLCHLLGNVSANTYNILGILLLIEFGIYR